MASVKRGMRAPRRADGTRSEITGKQDDERINVEQEHELGCWAEKLGVSREQLRKAVQAAGPMMKDIRRHLSH